MVWVETIALLCCLSANNTAGVRYASDLPTPVPASTTRWRSSSSACATAAAISCCCRRNSKFFALERSPFSEKNARTLSTNSVPRESFSAVIWVDPHARHKPRAQKHRANKPREAPAHSSLDKSDHSAAESPRQASATDHRLIATVSREPLAVVVAVNYRSFP